MKEFKLKVRLITLLAFAVAGTPVALHAQATNTLPPGFIRIANNQIPFRGKLTAVDTQIQTITLNNNTIQITTNTVITRVGKRTTLEEATPGEVVAGTYEKAADGKLKAVNLRLAPKHLTQPNESKTNKTDKATTP